MLIASVSSFPTKCFLNSPSNLRPRQTSWNDHWPQEANRNGPHALTNCFFAAVGGLADQREDGFSVQHFEAASKWDDVWYSLPVLISDFKGVTMKRKEGSLSSFMKPLIAPFVVSPWKTSYQVGDLRCSHGHWLSDFVSLEQVNQTLGYHMWKISGANTP